MPTVLRLFQTSRSVIGQKEPQEDAVRKGNGSRARLRSARSLPIHANGLKLATIHLEGAREIVFCSMGMNGTGLLKCTDLKRRISITFSAV